MCQIQRSESKLCRPSLEAMSQAYRRDELVCA